MSDKNDLDTHERVETALATLQPIRDLAKNWDIDIASCLEEYLHDLSEDLLPEDRQRVANAHGLNFAQAALVLQNSSNIYSRKVEYLYSLVYKAMEEMAVGQENNAKQKKRSKSMDPDVDDFLNFDPYQDFLLLDDVLPTDDSENCHKINLQEEPMDMARRLSESYASPHRSATRLSLGNTTTDRNMTNAVAHRALIGSLDTNSLRLVGGACDMGDDGLLRMPGTNSARKQSLPTVLPTTQEESATDFGAMDAFDNDSDGGGGFELADDYGGLPAAQQENVLAHDVKSTRRVTFAPSVKDNSEKKENPWELLDPHSEDTNKPRPLRIGKTIRLPAGLTDLPSECVTGASTRNAKRRPLPPPTLQTPSIESLATQTFHSVLNRKRQLEETSDSEDEEEVGKTLELPKIPMRGLVFGKEFAYIAKESAKRRAAELRARRQKGSTGELGGEKRIDDVPEMTEVDDDDGFGFGFAGDDDNDDFHDAFDSNTGGVMGNMGVVSVDEFYADDDAGSKGQTFEELCRAHISKFAKGAEKYAAETKLSQRVGNWQDRLAPLLTEEESRPVFDMIAYGNTVIERVTDEMDPKAMEDSATNTVEFGDITRHCPNYEVCRLFLASLSLSNSGNIELSSDKNDGANLQIKLLKKTIDRPMETYMAPSVTDEVMA